MRTFLEISLLLKSIQWNKEALLQYLYILSFRRPLELAYEVLWQQTDWAEYYFQLLGKREADIRAAYLGNMMFFNIAITFVSHEYAAGKNTADWTDGGIMTAFFSWIPLKSRHFWPGRNLKGEFDSTNFTVSNLILYHFLK